MQTKNYYQILGISSKAPTADIKVAYRKLALQYHPDRNADNILSETVFKEINEAYNVLSDTNKRAVYDRKHINELKHYEEILISPEHIYQNIHALRKQLEYADPYRMDKNMLSVQLEQLFSAYNLSVLERNENISVNNAVIDETLSVIKFLPLHEQEKIIQLFSYFPNHRKEKTTVYIKKQKNIFLWEKYKFALVLLVTIAICTVLYFIIK